MEARLAAEDTAALRRELVEYNRTEYAATATSLVVAAGKQDIRPPMIPDRIVARMLVETEAARLEQARLFHVDDALADLVDAAYPTMPPFAPRAHDLPSRWGFVTFARPLMSMVRPPNLDDEQLARSMAASSGEELAEVADIIRNLVIDEVPVLAVSWGPVEESLMAYTAPRWPAGAVWFTFYTMPVSVRHPEVLNGRPTGRALAGVPTRLIVDDEIIVGWEPEGADPEAWKLNHRELDSNTASWTAATLAAFLLARQQNVGEEEDVPVPRAERRRHKHAGIAEPAAVRVMKLRSSVARARAAATPAGGDAPTRKYRNRWIVGDHWRNVWYPKARVNRPRWIAPYLVSPPGVPEDAPLLGGDKVYRMSAAAPAAGTTAKET